MNWMLFLLFLTIMFFFNAYVNKVYFNNNSGWSYLELNGCRTFDAFYNGDLSSFSFSNISVKGSFIDNVFSIASYE